MHSSKRRRIAVLEEEIESLEAMLSHIDEQIEFEVNQYKTLESKCKQLKVRRESAYLAGEPNIQKLSIQISVAVDNMKTMNNKIREMQRHYYFVELDIHRKELVVTQLKTDIATNKKRKEIEIALKKRAKLTVEYCEIMYHIYILLFQHFFLLYLHEQ